MKKGQCPACDSKKYREVNGEGYCKNCGGNWSKNKPPEIRKYRL